MLNFGITVAVIATVIGIFAKIYELRNPKIFEKK